MSNLQMFNKFMGTPDMTPIEVALQVDAEGMTTAKKLYEFLELSKNDYSTWCKRNILGDFKAKENVDFTPFRLETERNPNPTIDYNLTASFAKRLAMQTRTERGREACDYFIKVEEKLKQSVITSKENSQIAFMKAALTEIEDQKTKLEEYEKRIDRIEDVIEKNTVDIPMLNDVIIDANRYTLKSKQYSTTQISDMFNINPRNFYKILEKLGIVRFTPDGGWSLEQQYEAQGIGVSKNSNQYGCVMWSNLGKDFIISTMERNGISPVNEIGKKRRRK